MEAVVRVIPQELAKALNHMKGHADPFTHFSEIPWYLVTCEVGGSLCFLVEKMELGVHLLLKVSHLSLVELGLDPSL